jgi:hypothetical protein
MQPFPSIGPAFNLLVWDCQGVNEEKLSSPAEPSDARSAKEGEGKGTQVLHQRK